MAQHLSSDNVPNHLRLDPETGRLEFATSRPRGNLPADEYLKDWAARAGIQCNTPLTIIKTEALRHLLAELEAYRASDTSRYMLAA